MPTGSVRRNHARVRRDCSIERFKMIAADLSTTTAPAPDFVVSGSGSVYLIHPCTATASDHLRRVVSAEAQFLGNAIAVGHRYLQGFVVALLEDGFTVVGES